MTDLNADRETETDMGDASSVEPPASAEPSAAIDAATAGRRAREILGALEGVILGQEVQLRQMMVTLLAGGHALLEGVPGTAKTLAVRSLAVSLDVAFGRVQFTPDLMPTDLTGVNILDERSRDFVFREGPLFAELLLADEINRAPAKTQSALLEAMQEGQVTVDGETRTLPPAFTVFATQNPIEQEGTYPLPEAQLDRFLLKILVGYPPRNSERGILDRVADGFRADRTETYGLGPMADADDLLALRQATRAVHVEPAIRDYIVSIVRETRTDPLLTLAASPRAGVALFSASRALALLEGRDFVIPDDVKTLTLPVLRHRVRLTPEAEVEGEHPDDRLHELLDRIRAPS